MFLAAADWARAAKLPLETPPSPDLALALWIRAAASPVIGFGLDISKRGAVKQVKKQVHWAFRVREWSASNRCEA